MKNNKNMNLIIKNNILVILMLIALVLTKDYFGWLNT